MGTVYLVGAGPGDEDLITLKGMELLKQCDTVIYDRLVSNKLLEYVKKDCKKIYVGKEAGKPSMTQDEINELLIKSAKTNPLVVRLKGGDPFVFGRGGEEVEELIRHKIPFHVVPGVTSAIAVPSGAGIPVTHRGVSQSFHVITGHTMAGKDMVFEQFKVLAKLEGTLIFLMALASIEKIVNNLIQHGKFKDTAVAVISNGTTPNQKIVRGSLATIVGLVEKEELTSPATIVIGETAKLNYQSTYKRDKEIRIGITASKAMRMKLRKNLENEGYQVVDVCNMKIVETPHYNELREAMKNIDGYNWILFTSQNAIELFFTLMDESKIDRRSLSKIKFAVIGSGCKEELRKYGYYADFMPNIYTTNELAVQFCKIVKEDEKILIPRAVQGSQELITILTENEINFNEFLFYDVVGELLEPIKLDNNCLDNIDCFIFASASGVNGFSQELKINNITMPIHKKIACIGEVTGTAVKKLNYPVDIVSSVSDTKGLVSRINDYYKYKSTAFIYNI